MKNSMRKTVSAFTLIEIVVVVAIIGILSTVAIVSMSSGRAERAVETEARGFAALVREAQNDALTGKQIIVGTDPCGFQISWGGGSYTFVYRYASLSGGTTCSAPSSSTVVTYALKNGVTLVGSSSAYYKPPHADLDFSSGNRSAVFSKSGKSHVVCMYFNGNVIDQKGSGCP